MKNKCHQWMTSIDLWTVRNRRTYQLDQGIPLVALSIPERKGRRRARAKSVNLLSNWSHCSVSHCFLLMKTISLLSVCPHTSLYIACDHLIAKTLWDSTSRRNGKHTCCSIGKTGCCALINSYPVHVHRTAGPHMWSSGFFASEYAVDRNLYERLKVHRTVKSRFNMPQPQCLWRVSIITMNFQPWWVQDFIIWASSFGRDINNYLGREGYI